MAKLRIATLLREMDMGVDDPFSHRIFQCIDFYKMAMEHGFELIAVAASENPFEICALCDGLLLPGSAKDIDPKYFGGEPLDPPQFMDEYALDARVIDCFVKQGKPIFGICGGLQDINIYFGGTIEKAVVVETHKDEDGWHAVSVAPDSFLYEAYGALEARTNSMHSWVIGRLGTGLRVVARCKNDGLIEAVENREMGIFATQWHPEHSYTRNDAVEKKMFENFFALCEERKNKR